MITDYIIVTGTHKYVCLQVMRMVEQGWKPHGGISIAIYSNNESKYAQAMIKEGQ